MQRQSSPHPSSAPLLALVAALSLPAQAGFEALLNPLGVGNPYGMGSNPLAAFANPYGNPYANPLGGLGGGLGLGALSAVPLLLGAPVGAGTLMHPGLQMAPNMMSHSHMNRMTNPYMGGPFGGNPYMQTSMPIPFAPPAFSPSMPTLPGLGGMPAYPVQGYGQPRPYPSAAAQPGAMQLPGQMPSGFSLPFLMPAPAAQPARPAPAAPQSTNPFLSFPARPAAVPAPAPQAKSPVSAGAATQAAVAGQAPVFVLPFLMPLPPSQPEAAKQPGEGSATKAATKEAPTTAAVKEDAAKAVAGKPAEAVAPDAAAPALSPTAAMPLPFDPTPWFGLFFTPPK